MFVHMTQTYSGDMISVPANRIDMLRQKPDKTLVIISGVGTYVDEPVNEIESRIMKALDQQMTVNITVDESL